MAFSSVGTVLPLWRIHNFTDAGTTKSIIDIGRQDTIALLRFLSGRDDPLSATGKLTLAVDYALEPTRLRKATLVRIKHVSTGSKRGYYSAELLVLCNARVENVSMRGSFPTATRGTDLPPLWRIHNLGKDGEVTFDTVPKEITNIARDDTVALLKRLGDGNVKRAKDHLVLSCDYKKRLYSGMRVMLARIGEVDYLSEWGQRPYRSTLYFLGHVRCAAAYTDGEYPECLLDEMPVWRIHQLNQSRGKEHKITNIARPDSIALLAHLGMGDPLNATGALVIGCDYDFPPSSGESGRLMRVAKIAHSTGDGKYEAVLVDVDTVSIGQLHVSPQRDSSWWPRAAIEVPKVWRSSAGGSYSDASPSPCCPYWRRCEQAVINMVRDSGLPLEEYRQKGADRCFCVDCHRRRGDDLVYTRGGEKYILPIGFARIGVKVYKTPAIAQTGFAGWHACYHGTKYNYLPDLLRGGQLLAPGFVTYTGEVIKIQENHIKLKGMRKNGHTGEWEEFDPTNKIFFSPSMKYCDYGGVYMTEYSCDSRYYRIALQIRAQPGTYQIGPETVLRDHKDKQIDEHVPNSSLEWYTNQLQAHFFTGVLVAER